MEHVFIEKSDNLIFREIDGEIVIVSNNGREIHALNKTASFIWKSINKGTSVGEITRKMCEQYGVDEDTASSDVLEMVRRMSEKNLIRVCQE